VSHALIVEDDAGTAEMLAALVAAEGFTTATAASLQQARRELESQRPDVVLLDLSLPDGSGIDLFDAVETPDPACEIVLITGHASLETSIQALRLGAADYLRKPVDVARLRAVLARAGGASEVRGRMDRERSLVDAQGRFGRIWGRSQSMREIYRRIERVAPTAVTALITGESGTGKEVVAQTIHELSKRSKAPFLAVNCGAIPPQLIESELFGHEKGSFTGAVRQHLGLFERADGGTLFLDEITEMPPELQVKLLRVLETGTFARVGSGTLLGADVRIIAATNRPPATAVATGQLREDLFYRLNVFPIQLPPLRERCEDIDLLAGHFLAELNESERARKHFTGAALSKLSGHYWRGNVRELRNVVHRGFILAEGDAIDAADLPLDDDQMNAGDAREAAPSVVADVRAAGASPATGALPTADAPPAAGAPSAADAPPPAGTSPAADAPPSASAPPAASASPAGTAADVQRPACPPADRSPPAQAAESPDTAPACNIPALPDPLRVDVTIGLSLAEVERRLILATLEHCGGRRERAATLLGISPKTLYNRLKAYRKA